jgi:DNA-binding LacI/PurR family transcriptional regulator
MITIRQLAKLAGVSPAAVSMALRDHPRIGTATRRRIQELAAMHGYHASVRGLAPGSARRGALGCIVPDVSTPFFSHALAGMIAAAFTAGYQIIPLPGRWDTRQTTQAMETLTAHGIDGLLLYPGQLAAPIPADALLSLLSQGLPTVCISNAAVAHPLDRVTMDEKRCGWLVIEHLYTLGHRRLAVVGANHTHPRRVALRMASRHFGVDLFCVEDCPIRLTPERIAPCFSRPSPPTALIGFDDAYAVKLMQFAVHQGWSVPKDLSIVSCCNLRMPFDPPLTTVELFPEEMGQRAVSLLLERLTQMTNPEPYEPVTFKVSPLLISGGTCAAPPR